MRYIGQPEFAEGTWLGIEMRKPGIICRVYWLVSSFCIYLDVLIKTSYRQKGTVLYDWGRKCSAPGMNKKCGFLYDAAKSAKLEPTSFGRTPKTPKTKMPENASRDLVEITTGLSLPFFN